MSGSEASYTRLEILRHNIVTADSAAGNLDEFNSTTGPVKCFTTSSLARTGYTPVGLRSIGSALYVSFASLSGAFVGTLKLNAVPISGNGLWGPAFGNEGSSEPTKTLYFGNGQVVSGTSGNLLGTFPITSTGLGATVDLTNHVAYPLSGNVFGNGNLTLSSFDSTTYTAIAAYAVPSGPTSAQGFVFLPSGCFAFEDGTRIYFLTPPPASGVKLAPPRRR